MVQRIQRPLDGLMPRVGDPADTNLRQLLADNRRESLQHDLVVIGNRQVNSIVPHMHRLYS